MNIILYVINTLSTYLYQRIEIIFFYEIIVMMTSNVELDADNFILTFFWWVSDWWHTKGNYKKSQTDHAFKFMDRVVKDFIKDHNSNKYFMKDFIKGMSIFLSDFSSLSCLLQLYTR